MEIPWDTGVIITGIIFMGNTVIVGMVMVSVGKITTQVIMM